VDLTWKIGSEAGIRRFLRLAALPKAHDQNTAAEPDLYTLKRINPEPAGGLEDLPNCMSNHKGHQDLLRLTPLSRQKIDINKV
jgi:hypothetical protein